MADERHDREWHVELRIHLARRGTRFVVVLWTALWLATLVALVLVKVL